MGTGTQTHQHTTPKESAVPTLVRPRLAASLVLVRGRGAAVEVLTGERARGHRFMPNKYVFPGGRVDPSDARAPCDGPLRGPDAERLARRLSPARVRATPLAAVRETLEETGLVIGRNTRALNAEVPAACAGSWQAFQEVGRVPAVQPLRLIARAITPTRQAVRFDAYFFLARLEDVDAVGDVHDSDELHDVAWRSLSDTRALNLPAVTRFVLEEACGHLENPGRAPMFLRTVRARHRVTPF